MVSGGYSSLRCADFSLRWLLLLRSAGSRRTGFSSCGTQAQSLWRTGLGAPRHMGSSWTGARTHVLCTGRRILNHCATREVLAPLFIFLQHCGSETELLQTTTLFEALASLPAHCVVNSVIYTCFLISKKGIVKSILRK